MALDAFRTEGHPELAAYALAAAIRVPLATLRNWEQHRTATEPSTIALMTILAREPEAALRALGKRAA